MPRNRTDRPFAHRGTDSLILKSAQVQNYKKHTSRITFKMKSHFPKFLKLLLCKIISFTKARKPKFDPTRRIFMPTLMDLYVASK